MDRSPDPINVSGTKLARAGARALRADMNRPQAVTGFPFLPDALATAVFDDVVLQR